MFAPLSLVLDRSALGQHGALTIVTRSLERGWLGGSQWQPIPVTKVPCKAALSTSWFLDNDYRRGGFYNWREHKWVMMLNVNIRALIDWNEAHSSALFNAADVSNNGLVFFLSVKAIDATTTPPPASRRYGVRIFDSANLNTSGGTFPRPNQADPTGLTVVSDQAVYVQGNYNYYPSMTLADKFPAAVLGDTLNVISQSWEVPVIVNSSG